MSFIPTGPLKEAGDDMVRKQKSPQDVERPPRGPGWWRRLTQRLRRRRRQA